MVIKNLMAKYNHNTLNKEQCDEIRSAKSELSKVDKNYLQKYIRNHNSYSKEEVIKSIVFYCIWNSDEAIKFAREKGALRYRSYGNVENNANYYITELLQKTDVINYSDDTLEYLQQKNSCNWMSYYYANIEKRLIEYIKSHHKKRLWIKKNKVCAESTIFLELLSYLDLSFLYNKKANDVLIKGNKDVLAAYSNEEISEAVSYLIYLYDSELGIRDDKFYWLDTKYVLSDDIENLILEACKMNLLVEWEILIDYYSYGIEKIDGKWVIADKDNLEKSICLGYVKQLMQQVKFNDNVDRKSDESSLSF